MSLDQYQRVMDGISLCQDHHATIEGDQAYYSSRDRPRYKKIVGEELPFQGSINRCRCMDCTPILLGTEDVPRGISGQKIAFASGKQPTEEVYQRSTVHRGSRGLLRGRFWCRVAIPVKPVEG